MADYAELKQNIAAVIRSNNRREITGQILQNTLFQMVGSLGENYQLAGFASPTDNPLTPDQTVFYITDEAGVYTNFGNITLGAGLSFLMWKDSQWTAKTISMATQSWVDTNYVSKAFLRKLFKPRDAIGTEIFANDTASIIDSIEAMVGLWTEKYISAYGQNAAGGGSSLLANLDDVSIDETTLANNQVLTYDSTTLMWVNKAAQGGTDMNSVWAALAAETSQQINASHLTTALSGYVTSSSLSTTLASYVTTTALDTTLASYATQQWVGQNYVSIAYFNQLFSALDSSDAAVAPNNTTTTIASLKLLVGTWTEQFLSAYGMSSQGSGGDGTLAGLDDVEITSPSAGQALVYDATNDQWVNGTAGVNMDTVWTALANEDSARQINISHLTNALSSYVTSSSLSTTLASYVTTSALTTTLASYVTNSALTTTLAAYATQQWVGNNYVSIAFFNRLFNAFNGSTQVEPNDTTSTINNIKAMFGLWTEEYLSAYGISANGNVVLALEDLTDVNITSVTDGQVLKYDALSGKWVNGTGGGSNVGALNDLSDVTITSLADKDILQYDYANSAWKNVTLSTALADYATQSWVGQQGYLTSISAATSNALGGIKVGYTTSGKNYKVQLDASNNAYVNVPWTDTTYDLSGYATQTWVGNNYLPLTGGTVYANGSENPLVIKSASSSSYLAFKNNNGTTIGYLGVNSNSQPVFYNTRNILIWTESNDGSGSGLDADLLDGQQGSYYAAASSLNNYLPLSGGNMSGRIYFTQSGTGLLNVDSVGIYIQTGSHWLRAGTGGCDCDGYAIIHAGNIASQSVASAAQLTTSRTIWGQSFNGTGNVDGKFTLDKSSFTSTEYAMKIKHGSYDCNGAPYDFLVIAAQDAPTIRMQDGGEQSQLGICMDANVAHYTSTGEFKFYAGGTKNTAVWSGMGGTNILRLTSTDAYINGNLNPSNLFVINNSSNSAYDSMVYLENKSNSDWALHINCSGYSYGLQIQAQDNQYGLYALCGAHISGSVGIGTTTLSYKLNVAGDIYATGGVTSLSDIRKKDVISYELPLSVEQIANAPTIKFLWVDKREEGEQVGTIAQYWEKALPWVIKSKSGELSMSYGVTALIAAITTARKVVDHERRITELEKENAGLKQAYSFLEKAYNELKLKVA